MPKITKAQARRRLNESIAKIQQVVMNAGHIISTREQQDLYKIWIKLGNISKKIK
jgi:predicted esterase